jgi:multicomponent K+:H+ antiporter subunit G
MNLEDVPLWAALPASVLLVIGSLFALVGAVGLLRMKDFLTRFHTPALGTSLGTLCILASSVLVFSAVGGRAVIHEILIYIFLVITAPVTAMLLVRAALYRKHERPLAHMAPGSEALPESEPDEPVHRHR